MILTVNISGKKTGEPLEQANQNLEIAKKMNKELQSIIKKCKSIIEAKGEEYTIDTLSLSGKNEIEKIEIFYKEGGKNEKIELSKGELLEAFHNLNISILETLTSDTLLNIIGTVTEKYPEMQWLTGDTDTTPESGIDSDESKTLGEKFFSNLEKADLVEFNRTAVGILVLKWVILDDYESFTACQKDDVKLSRESFTQLRKYVQSIIPDEEAVDAMITFMVINDLTKIKSVVQDIQKKSGIKDVDHDKLLLVALKDHPEVSPSFQRLSPKYQGLMLNGLKAEFNIGQFIQGENVAANLEGLKGIDEPSLKFYLLHALCDIAGAAGQFVQNGSVVMTEPTYQGFRQSISALEKLSTGEDLVGVYNDYLSQKSEGFALDIEKPFERAITRICCMLRYSTYDQAHQVIKAFKSLPKNVQAILEEELNKNGVADGFATLIYYSPALLANLQKSMNDSSEEALKTGLTQLARIYQEARINIKNNTGDGVYTVMASSMAKMASDDPQSIEANEIHLERVGNDAEVVLKPFPTIDETKFSHITNLSEISGDTILPIGMGGGSDCVQAAQFAQLLQESGKQVPAVVSVRTGTTSSQGVDGKIGESRIPENAQEVSNGIYLIDSETKMKGRALEPVIAAYIPTYLILIEDNLTLTSKLETLKNHLGNIDTVIGVDTGGDALYSTTVVEQAKATPDQDIQVLEAINSLEGVDTLSAEIAVGVDTPENGEEVLLQANAGYFELNDTQIDSVMNQYKDWNMDGSSDEYFGKTALSWQKALQNQVGLQVLDLPSRVVTDEKNPWKTFVNIQSSTKGIFIMETKNHLKAIGK